MAQVDYQLRELARASHKSALMSFAGLAILALSLGFAGWRLNKARSSLHDMERRVGNLEQERRQLETSKVLLQREVSTLGDQRAAAAREAATLDVAVSTLLFAALDAKAIAKIAPRVDWASVAAHVRSLEPGARKTAVLLALLTTWRKVPQRDGGTSLETGMDSPRFLNFVLAKSGLPATEFTNDQPASVSLMNRFPRKTTEPQSGDLMFFATGPGCPGVGNPACMYLAPGTDGGRGVCVGVPFYSDILQVLDSQSFPAACRFLGYFHVPYEAAVNGAQRAP